MTEVTSMRRRFINVLPAIIGIILTILAFVVFTRADDAALLGGILLIIAIALFVSTFASSRALFVIEYAGGAICFYAGHFGNDELVRFQMTLRKAIIKARA